MKDTGPFLLSLDYELFFGSNVGSIEKCLIEPTDALADCLEQHGGRLVLFVDAGYLSRSKEESHKAPRLSRELDQVLKHLAALSARGHDIQLHIHPHWEASHYDAQSGWIIDLKQYRLHDIPSAERTPLVQKYAQMLADVSGEQPFAYRAGGWCLQPFAEIRDALLSNGVWLDSTAYEGGHSSNPGRFHHFANLPQKPFWRFEEDPAQECADGRMVEVPISSMLAMPMLFWRMALQKLKPQPDYQAFGDGAAIANSKRYTLRRLLWPTHMPVSVDGVKGRYLEQAHGRQRQLGSSSVFNVMGHPKALTPSSIQSVHRFLSDGHVSRVETFTSLERSNFFGQERAA